MVKAKVMKYNSRNGAIRWKYMTSYLIIYEMFTNQIKFQKFDLEIGQGQGKNMIGAIWLELLSSVIFSEF